MADLLDLDVRALLAQTASESPTPGGGAVSAVTAALAAALLEMAAQNSPDWSERGAALAQAGVLRERLTELAPANDEIYEHAIAALRMPEAVGSDAANAILGPSLERAAASPLAIAEAAADVAELAALVAENGHPTVQADAAAAAMLALGATRAAAHLVEINLAVLEHDERLLRATRAAANASAATVRTLSVTQ